MVYKETYATYSITQRVIRFPEYSDSKFIVGYEDLFDSINRIICINFKAKALIGLRVVLTEDDIVSYKIHYL